jgi:transcriptional regulator with XRE-family HTH domain
MARSKKFTQEEVAMIKSLLETGSSVAEIAEAKGVGLNRIYRISKLKIKKEKISPAKKLEDLSNEEIVERATNYYTELDTLKKLMSMRHEESIAITKRIQENIKLLSPELNQSVDAMPLENLSQGLWPLA